MEPQTCLALPGEEKEIVVWTASQNPHGVQESVSHALGIPMNRVEVKIKRLGGGFGGTCALYAY
jgi:xanthine dehydrogenase molybdopterin-binding subunit B